MKSRPWKVLSEFVRIGSPWVTIVGENLEDEAGTLHEYWRVEKPDGVLIITVQSDRLVLPKPMYRPGIGTYTLDFCGGRIDNAKTPEVAAATIVQRELHLETKEPLMMLHPINEQGLVLDSSSSNVCIYGFVAELSPVVTIDEQAIGATFSCDKQGVDKLLIELSCLQCRGMLLEWVRLQPSLQ